MDEIDASENSRELCTLRQRYNPVLEYLPRKGEEDAHDIDLGGSRLRPRLRFTRDRGLGREPCTNGWAAGGNRGDGRTSEGGFAMAGVR